LRPALRGLLTTLDAGRGALMLVAPASKVSVLSESAATDAASMVEHIAGARIEEPSTFPIADAEALAIARRDDPVIARVAARFVTLNPELSRDQAETIAIERGVDLAHEARVRRDGMYDVMLRCLDWLASRGGRHRLILVSGGFATESDDAKYLDVVTRSLQANAPIDVLDARGLAGFDRYHDVEFGPSLSRNADEGPFGRFEAGEGPMGLAVDTGGIIVSNTNDMRRGLDELLDSMATYYIVGYQPPPHAKPGHHKIKVDVRGKNLRVRARTGYQSP
jgi:VWFA-related protein